MRIVLVILCIVLLIGCDTTLVDSQSVSFKKAQWPIQTAPVFSIQSPDTTQTYDLFINLRNTHQYAYSNLFVVSEIKFPKGQIITDTLEYEMTTPQGHFLGSGDQVIENKLWCKKGIRFRESGTYQLTLRHLMRDARSVEGIAQLKGILDIGYSIENPMNNGNNK